MTEAAQEELSQIPLISWLAATTNTPTLQKTAERAVEVVKERMKKRPKEETTPIPRIYHDGLQDVAQQECCSSTTNLSFNAVQPLQKETSEVATPEPTLQDNGHSSLPYSTYYKPMMYYKLTPLFSSKFLYQRLYMYRDVTDTHLA